MASAQDVIQMMTEAQIMQAAGNRAGADAAAAAAAQAASQLGNVQLHAAVVNHANSWGPTAAPAPAPSGGGPPPPPPPPPGKSQEQILWEIENARRDAENLRRRTNAFDEMKSMFDSWGMDVDGSLLNTVRGWIWSDKSTDYVLVNFRKTDAYNRRFTGMRQLVARGQFMNEAEYIAQERAYRNLIAQWDLPKGFYDSYDDFGGFIGNGVSVKEVDDRIRSAKTILDEDTDQEYRDALGSIGVSTGSLIAHILDATRAQDLIVRQVKRVATLGAGNKFGFDMEFGEGDKYAAFLGERYNTFGVDQRNQLEGIYSGLGALAENQEKLAFIDKDDEYERTDILDAELLNDTDEKMKSRARALREKARWNSSIGGWNLGISLGSDSGF